MSDDLGKVSVEGEVDDDGEVRDSIETTMEISYCCLGLDYGCQDCNLRK